MLRLAEVKGHLITHTVHVNGQYVWIGPVVIRLELGGAWRRIVGKHEIGDDNKSIPLRIKTPVIVCSMQNAFTLPVYYVHITQILHFCII